MNNNIQHIIDRYKSGSLTERLCLFCEYRHLREEFMEIEGLKDFRQPQASPHWLQKLLSAFSIKNLRQR